MEKNLSKAVSFKERGNSEYKSKRTESSLKYYTEALFYAPCLNSVLDEAAKTLRESCDDNHLKLFLTRNNLPSTDSGVTDDLIVAHCYGNRSAALLDLKKYKDALVDIQLAMYHGYPKKEFKLYKRKAICLSHLGRQSEALEVVERYREASRGLESSEKVRKNVQTLTREIRQIRGSPSCGGNNEMTGSFVSSSLCVDVSPEKGRCVMAKKDIAFGECVLSEPPHVSFLYDKYSHTHCNHCFKEIQNIIPCYFCVSCGYCSVSCMQTAWKLYHWVECAHRKIFNDHTGLASMTVRLLLTSLKDVKMLLQVCQKSNLSKAIATLTSDDSTDISEVYKCVLKLSDTSSESSRRMCHRVIDDIMECYSDQLTSYFKIASLSSSTLMDSLKELLLLHVLQLQANTIMVSADTIPSNYQQGGGTEMATVDTQNYGSALYLTASLFNHSCDHNMFRNFIVGNTINVLVYCSVLKKGDELCLSYGPKVGYMKISQRKKELKDKRHFDCSCIACNKPSKEMLRREFGWYGFSCPQCKGLLPKPDSIDEVMSECIDCGHSTNITPLLKMESELGRWATSFRDMYQLHQMLTDVVYKHNTLLRDCCKSITSFYVQQGDHPSAIKYSKQRCNIIEAIHGSHSSELACALPNHCRILVSRDRRASKRLARKALMLVELYYGVDDEDARLLREFLKSS